MKCIVNGCENPTAEKCGPWCAACYVAPGFPSPAKTRHGSNMGRYAAWARDQAKQIDELEEKHRKERTKMIFDEFEGAIKKVDAWEVDGERIESLTEARVVALDKVLRKELMDQPEVKEALGDDEDQTFRFESLQEFVVFVRSHSFLFMEYLTTLADLKKPVEESPQPRVICSVCGNPVLDLEWAATVGPQPFCSPGCKLKWDSRYTIQCTKCGGMIRGFGEPPAGCPHCEKAEEPQPPAQPPAKTAYCQKPGCGWEGFTAGVPRACPKCKGLSIVNLTVHPTTKPK